MPDGIVFKGDVMPPCGEVIPACGDMAIWLPPTCPCGIDNDMALPRCCCTICCCVRTAPICCAACDCCKFGVGDMPYGIPPTGTPPMFCGVTEEGRSAVLLVRRANAFSSACAVMRDWWAASNDESGTYLCSCSAISGMQRRRMCAINAAERCIASTMRWLHVCKRCPTAASEGGGGKVLFSAVRNKTMN